ncbi:hypothetical protein [Spirillospora sp. NPDC047279]|uniref:hypothetical protein n=1 Tax=Spirillospora sp. NPDC047279 TaxID=3155478 RepID=UPI0033E81599
MAHDAALMRTVSVRLRRVACSRLLHRLLVLAGIVIAGWLLGGAAQAHADEGPIPDASGIVAQLPVVKDVAQAPAPAPRTGFRDAAQGLRDKAKAVLPDLRTARPGLTLPEPVRDVTGELTAPRPATGGDGRAVMSKRPVASEAAKVSRGEHTRAAASGTPKAAAGTAAAPMVAAPQPAPAPAPLAPLHAPAQAGTVVPAGGAALLGGLGGHLGRWSWTAARPRPVLMPGSGAVPPLVRTAADEPTFSPD